MEHHCLTIIGCLLALTLVPYTVSVEKTACNFPAIFNFGDSNSDTGGWSAAFGQAAPPNGESFFGAPAGRYCDGRLLIDFISENLGLGYLNAYLDSMGSNFTHGANFATAASTIRPLFQEGISPFNLNVQTYQLSDFRHRSQIFRDRGAAWAPKAEDFSRALYTFDIGQNDLTAGYSTNMSQHQVRAYVLDVLNHFKTAIKRIYHEQGGRFFWIHNTGPIGCLPYIMDNQKITAGQVSSIGCVGPFIDVAKYFNTRLKKAVAQLRRDLPLAAVTYVDVFSLRYSLFSHPKIHGFDKPLETCCGHGGKYNYNSHVGCGGNITVNGKKVLIGSCKDPSVKVVWDGVHYTQAANKFVFDRIVDGSYSDPPIPLKMACHRQ